MRASSLPPGRRRLRVGLAALAWATAPAYVAAAAAGAADDGFEALRGPGVVLFRHANAPGIGDPAGFRLGDCATQRNLDAAGRAQARRLGERFRSHEVQVGAVLSSRWCRTHETAERAFPGQVHDDPDFDSFFDAGSREPAQTARAEATIRRWRGPGVLVVVTHQVNITALTGRVPAAAVGVVVRPRANGPGLDVVARVTP